MPHERLRHTAQCSGEEGPDRKFADWLVSLSRSGSEWREAQRVQTDGYGQISCALSDSRVLIGQYNYMYMELSRALRGSTASTCPISTAGSLRRAAATLVATSHPFTDQSVRVHRLHGDRLEELARIQLKYPEVLLWLADRLLVALARRPRARSERHATRTPARTHRHQREHLCKKFVCSDRRTHNL